jgi:two-component system chemotaxis response regulator CheB
MPRAALGRTRVDHVETLASMPALLDGLVREPAGQPVELPATTKLEVEIAAKGRSTGMSEMDRIGRRSVIACPDCHGVMWEIDDGGPIRYRCHVGHAYTAEFVNIALDANLNRAMGSALRALEERVAVSRKLEQQSISQGREALGRSWAKRAREFEQEAQIIRNSIRRIDDLAFRSAQGEQDETDKSKVQPQTVDD